MSQTFIPNFHLKLCGIDQMDDAYSRSFISTFHRPLDKYNIIWDENLGHVALLFLNILKVWTFKI